MAKKIIGEDGKVYKVKKPFYKKVWFWAVIVLVVGSFGSTIGEDKSTTKASDEVVETPVEEIEKEVEVEEVEAEEIEEPAEESTEEEVEEPVEETASREHRNALSSAQNYVDLKMGFSDSGLREQLAFENFPQDAIDYAMANVVVDFKEQAVISARNYDSLDMGFSDQGLIDQLIFEGFTQEQAEHGLNNLD